MRYTPPPKSFRSVMALSVTAVILLIFQWSTVSLPSRINQWGKFCFEGCASYPKFRWLAMTLNTSDNSFSIVKKSLCSYCTCAEVPRNDFSLTIILPFYRTIRPLRTGHFNKGPMNVLWSQWYIDRWYQMTFKLFTFTCFYLLGTGHGKGVKITP